MAYAAGVPKMIVLGGTGQVGRAIAVRLAGEGWHVVCSGRSRARFPAELRDARVEFAESDRYDADDLQQLLTPGADVVVDCVGYTAGHSRMLFPFQAGIGSVVFISSKAVYVDSRGRHSNSDEPPDFGAPVTEEQPTLAPADADYQLRKGYGASKVAAEQILLGSDLPVSILRPSRVHGAGAARPREWVFVKRVLDGRTHVLLARGGRGVNHPTAAVNLAALVAFCAARPGTRVLNSADPDAPDGLAISRLIARHLGHVWTEILLDDTAPAGLGAHPWDTLPPFVLDTSAAQRLGYVPAGSYADTVTAEIDRLMQAARSGVSGAVPPADDPYFASFFDYDREDAWIAGAASHFR